MARSLRTSFFGLILFVVGTGGCAEKVRGPVVFYLDGAGWYTSAGSVESGLRKAGFKGTFQRFSWSAFLGPAHDHLINARSGLLAGQLARRIEKARAANPDAPIHVMGLSAGTSLVLLALEKLDDDVKVDNVVLFSSSASSKHNLTKAMQHVERNLYATTSPHDSILSTLPVNADGKGGPPAGQMGFRFPGGGGRETIAAYQRVVNLPWQPSYLGFGWNGSHTSVTDSEFVAAVIAPRVLTTEPYPLDRSIAAANGQGLMVSP
jgi:pimeloyl-ACP methyl ester carboxylesterase